MYRAIPTSNKLLQKRWADKEREIHMNKLKDIKATVEIREPSSFNHLKKKLKKTQMLEDRYTEIERENRILLEKMTNIMQTSKQHPATAFPGTASISQGPAVGSIQQSLAQGSLQTAGVGLQKKSLNREARKRELLKITMENQAFLRRLQDKQAHYNVYRWEEEEQERKKLLKNICEYNYIIDQPGLPGTQSQMQAQSQTNYNSGPPDYIIKKKGAQTQQPLYKKRGYTSDNAQDMQQSRMLNGMHQKLETLYNGQQDLGTGIFAIEIFLSSRRDLIISAQHIERSDSFVIEIQNDKVQGLINEFKDDYGLMAEHLKIMNKRMVLLNPKFTNRQASKSVSPDKNALNLQEEQVIELQNQHRTHDVSLNEQPPHQEPLTINNQNNSHLADSPVKAQISPKRQQQDELVNKSPVIDKSQHQVDQSQNNIVNQQEPAPTDPPAEDNSVSQNIDDSQLQQ